MISAQLILESGETFLGSAVNLQADTQFGEVVFNTSMAGYVEALTDPSYAGQILVFTYPLIGNYGVPKPAYWESNKIQVAGIIVSELAPFYCHHAAQRSLSDWLKEEQIPVLAGVDTRALTHRLREQGAIAGAITHLGNKPKIFIDINQQHLVKQVSIVKPINYGTTGHKVILVDCGMKLNILRCLENFPLNIKRVPYDYDYTEEDYDGILLSNGPGDPNVCLETITILQKALKKRKPIFGICLGAQLLALAVGAKTYKLKFGHRGQNQPCLHIPSNKCFLTSQNHGFAIDAETLPHDWQVSFSHLNDLTVAGIEHKTEPFFAVQFHPEAAPGPLDTLWLFDKFYASLQRGKPT